MLQSYQGHFKEDTRFYTDEGEVIIPANKTVIITVLDDDTDNRI